MAVIQGDLRATQLLVAAGADANVPGPDCETPLHLAVGLDDVAMVKSLLAGQGDLRCCNAAGQTPLDLATPVMRLHIERLGHDTGDAPPLARLLQAVQQQRHDHLALLLRVLHAHGQSVDALGEAGCAALHLACGQGDARAVDLLLTARPDVNTPTPAGDTPLHYAVYAGHVAAVRQLLARGADCGRKNTDGISPIDLAGDSPELRELLRAHQAAATPAPKPPKPAAEPPSDSAPTTPSRRKQATSRTPRPRESPEGYLFQQLDADLAGFAARPRRTAAANAALALALSEFRESTDDAYVQVTMNKKERNGKGKKERGKEEREQKISK